MKITTGFAYIQRNGVNVGEICLPIGAQYSPAAGDTLIEVASRQELDAVPMTPPPKTDDQILNDAINARIKKLATDSLTADGSISVDGAGKMTPSNTLKAAAQPIG